MRIGFLVALAVLVAAPSNARANVGANGVNMNGVNMNGVNMNGVNMNGASLNGVALSGVTLSGVSVTGLTVVNGRLQGSIIDAHSTCAHSQRATGAPLDGCSPCAKIVAAHDAHCATTAWDQACVNDAVTFCTLDDNALLGATFDATVTDDNGVTQHQTLRLDSKQLAPDPAPVWRSPIPGVRIDVNNDVWLYSFSYWRPYGRVRNFGSWQPICPENDRDGAYNTAIAVAGTWNACEPGKPGWSADKRCGGKSSRDGVAIACNDVGALAKCVLRFQYKPWHSAIESANGVTHPQSLEPYHEACVRMVRGDYCGDGAAHTEDGTPIDAFDGVGVMSRVPNLGGNYGFEAGWTPNGAACVSNERVSLLQPGALDRCPWLAVPAASCDVATDLQPNMSLPLSSTSSDWPRNRYQIGDDDSQCCIY